jgi:LysR family transcriptional regulator, regulator for bpeEF and oprC
MDQLNDLASFAAVAETKGFAAAARRLGVSTAGVSKSVIRLEERLKVRLFTRTTRRVALTPEGERFYARCRVILDDLSEAENEITDATMALSGRIRIDMPIVYGERHVLPILAAFRTNNPRIELDIRMSDTFTDLIEEGVDLALRFGDMDDRRFVAKRLRPSRLVTCAAPAYFAERGTPKTLDDLSKHSCLTFLFRSSGRPFRWRFKLAGQSIDIDPQQGLSVNDGAAHRKLALLGLGIIQDLHATVDQELQAGSLVECLKPYATTAFPLSIVWPAGRHQSRRVRALIDVLARELGK